MHGHILFVAGKLTLYQTASTFNNSEENAILNIVEKGENATKHNFIFPLLSHLSSVCVLSPNSGQLESVCLQNKSKPHSYHLKIRLLL